VGTHTEVYNMKKRLLSVIMALLLMGALSSCKEPDLPDGTMLAGSNNTIISNISTPLPEMTAQPKAPAINFDDSDDPFNEEDFDDTGLVGSNGNAVPVSLYAGATPMPLDPIDMPTPTPPPKLTFTYQTYEITRMGISFSAPVGWEIDDSVDGTIILSQPLHSVLDNYRAYLSIEIRSVGSTLTKAEMRSRLTGTLDTIRGEFVSWENKQAADRTLFGQPGLYNDYRGVMLDGTIVRGRVHVACVSKKAVIVHLSCPGNFNEDYMGGVYAKLRSTLKETK